MAEEVSPSEDDKASETPTDASTTTTTTSRETENDEDTKTDPETMANLTKFLHETKAEPGGKSLWGMTLETFGMADGKTKKGDILVKTLEEAMSLMRARIAEEKEEKWTFPVTPLKELGSTVDDLLESFCHWAHKKEEDSFNVSKAFRRLEAYVDWMDQHKTELAEPMTPEALKPAADAWNFFMTHGKDGDLVWWFDLAAIDRAIVKQELPLTDSLRYFVFTSHAVVLDKKAQKAGMVMMEGLDRVGMIEMFTFMPPDLSAKLDRLTIGILPVRMNACYILGAGRWLHVLLNLMKPFMSKKMRQRIIPLKKKDDPKTIVDNAVGEACIPKGFAGMEGTVEEDLLKQKYFK